MQCPQRPRYCRQKYFRSNKLFTIRIKPTPSFTPFKSHFSKRKQFLINDKKKCMGRNYCECYMDHSVHIFYNLFNSSQENVAVVLLQKLLNANHFWNKHETTVFISLDLLLMSGGYLSVTNRQLLTMTWPMAVEWRESECDQPLVIDYDLAYGC